jgi:hypothetical protein
MGSLIPFSISKFSLNLIQTSKIRIKFNSCPKFMKPAPLFIQIPDLSKKNIKLNSMPRIE